ncbi:MAG: hypothetical protein AAF938_04900 [Myxococcota bacterium]
MARRVQDVDVVVVDGSRWPLVHSKYPKRIEDGDVFLQTFRQGIETVLGMRPNQPFLHLADLSQTENTVNAKSRRRMAEMLTELEEEFGKPIADCVVVRSRALQLIGTGVTFLQGSLRYTRKFFSDLDEGERWLLSRAEDAGLSFPLSTPARASAS